MSLALQQQTKSPSGRRVALPRGLGAVQFAAAAVDGLVLSSITVHALVRLRLSDETVGTVLAAAAAMAIAAAPICGAVADRVGLRCAGAGYAAASAVALTAYAATRSLTGYAVAAVLFVTAQAASGSVRHALAVAGVVGADRTRLRASMHTALNAGFGCGTVLGVAVLATATDAVFSIAYVLGALLCAVTAWATLRLRGPDIGARPASTGGTWCALRDRRFAGAVALACLLQLTMPILSLLLPVWVLRSAAPAWTAGLALAVNTALVITVQRGWAARLVNARATAFAASVAAAAIIAAGLILAAVPYADSPATAVALVLAAVIALTAGEVSGGAAVWQVALQHIDPQAEGRYQAAFSMSASGARVLGPLVALPLVLKAGSLGWVLLTVAIGTACVLIARRALTAASDPTPRTPARRPPHDHPMAFPMTRSSPMTGFDSFLTERERASTAFVEGDVSPLLAVSVDADPATIYPPTGVVVEGAQAVNRGNTGGAASFSPGAQNRFEILHSGADGDWAIGPGSSTPPCSCRASLNPC